MVVFVLHSVSPERLFLQYILDLCDQPRADKLATACGLDINNLYQTAANLKLEKGDVQQATRFFQQSKVRNVNTTIRAANLHWVVTFRCLPLEKWFIIQNIHIYLLLRFSIVH